MHQTPLPWWRTDEYTIDEPVPAVLDDYAGPHGVALVRAWPNGKTDPDWGLRRHDQPEDRGFMARYTKKNFAARRSLASYTRNLSAIAIVMRSLSMLCVDIDGKNGGFQTAINLGILPPTLAETSKSGNGYHLFYLTDEQWGENGFDKFQDRISLFEGIDIRATGCVYHFQTQRWNARQPVMIPDGLATKLNQHKDQTVARKTSLIRAINSSEEHEILMLQTDLIDELQKPIPTGKRNNTLFAIGSQLKVAQVEGWEELVHARAIAVGLDQTEADKLVSNISTYA